MDGQLWVHIKFQFERKSKVQGQYENLLSCLAIDTMIQWRKGGFQVALSHSGVRCPKCPVVSGII
ncbi:hypothetical protein D3H65_28140 [Paraflavitalea soli]|uniref:Uncharacterized protein n=1 Tax=Paraflavitalea soli TaxID=2315862 RepID=A0A3B7MX73_9BACT|nr:hypothetical protein D3H65_28140 [Paraflavitalea soli]